VSSEKRLPSADGPTPDEPPTRSAGEPSVRRRRSKPRAADVSGLILVATPIGNAGDISERALDVLAAVDVIACEDTRVTGKLLHLLAVDATLLPYHEHNAAKQRPKLIERLQRGETVALVSDAGMPAISDPGYKLVAACIEEGIALTCVPGPSSVTTALALSGLPTDRFFFQGFLPSKAGARRNVLAEIGAVPGTLVVMESAKRLAAMLEDATQVLGDRGAAVARELTKRFEEVRRGTLSELARHYAEAGPPKGEITVVIGPPGEAARMDADAIDAMLEREMQSASLRDAAAAVATASGWPRRDVYQRALALSAEAGRPDP